MQLLKSKTVWVAIIQAVVGIGVAVFTELDMVGYIAVLKSVGDIALRMVTTEAIIDK